jgi:DNA polymerase-3 subunit delta
VILPRLDKMTRSGAWFGALESFGVTIQVDPVERAALPQWIAQRLARQGQRVAPGDEGQRTLQFFADRVEGNLLAAHQEIQKLALLYPEGELGFEQVESAVLNVARYDVFKLSEAVLAGQAAPCSACWTACRPKARPRCWCTTHWPRTSVRSSG